MEKTCGNCKALVKEWPDGRKREGTFGCKLDSGLHYLTDEACTVWVGCGVSEEPVEEHKGAKVRCDRCMHYGDDGRCHLADCYMSERRVDGDDWCSNWENKENGEGRVEERKQRGTILDESKRIINGVRQDAYGNPEDSFSMIAELWDAWLEKKKDFHMITTRDVAVMLALMKVARIAGGNDRDSYRDACGYLALAADMTDAEDKEKD